MTLKEIYKIIDEYNIYLELDGLVQCDVSSPYCSNDKEYFLERVSHCVNNGEKVILLKVNKKGEIVKQICIDHIDKEKKIIKKKLEEMTDEEIENFKKRVCCKHWECFDCPFYNGETREDYSPCYEAFIYYRSGYLKYKDREIEIEVEE